MDILNNILSGLIVFPVNDRLLVAGVIICPILFLCYMLIRTFDSI